MQSKVVRMLAFSLVLLGVGMAMGQQNLKRGEEKLPTKRKKTRAEEEIDVLGPDHPAVKGKAQQKKSKLEEMLAEALKNNADIRVAIAKMAEAEAELNRTRIQVTQQVAMLYHAIETQKQVVQHAERTAMRVQQLGGGAVPVEKRDEVSQTLAVAKAKLAELEAQMPGLLGNSPSGYSMTIQQAKLVRQEAVLSLLQTRTTTIEEAEGKMAHKGAGPMADKIRKALDRSISVAFENQPIAVIVDFLSGDSGLVIKQGPGAPVQEKLTVRGEKLPFGAVLQLLEDSLPGYIIVVRDYGLLITHVQNVPPGAISVQEFLRQKPAEK